MPSIGATPGPLRVVIELLLHAVAIAAPRIVWPTLLAFVTSLYFLAFLQNRIDAMGTNLALSQPLG